MGVRVASGDRAKQVLVSDQPTWPGALPRLDTDEAALLREWLSGSAESRPWASLLKVAGGSRIELAERLADKALGAGLCSLKQKFDKGRWWHQALVWIELEALQQAHGLPTRGQREAQRAALAERLDALMSDPLVGEAAQALGESRLALDVSSARADLLEALQRWVAEGRQGLRQDFALHLEHTKAISPGEWDWLQRHFDLPALGVGSFAPTVTLAGGLSLHWPGERRLDLGVAVLHTLAAEALTTLQAITQPPQRWWLIENRASFEKQAARRASGDALVWIAGRPTRAWAAAMSHLLRCAPAPAAISADTDPAGIDIALAAAQPWEAAGLSWTATAMEPERLDRTGLQPLARYDLGVLERLAGIELPPELAALAAALKARGVKAEQEGWL